MPLILPLGWGTAKRWVQNGAVLLGWYLPVVHRRSDAACAKRRRRLLVEVSDRRSSPGISSRDDPLRTAIAHTGELLEQAVNPVLAAVDARMTGNSLFCSSVIGPSPRPSCSPVSGHTRRRYSARGGPYPARPSSRPRQLGSWCRMSVGSPLRRSVRFSYP